MAEDWRTGDGLRVPVEKLGGFSVEFGRQAPDSLVVWQELLEKWPDFMPNLDELKTEFPDRTLQKKIIHNFEIIALLDMNAMFRTKHQILLELNKAEKLGISRKELDFIKQCLVADKDVEEIKKEINQKREQKGQKEINDLQSIIDRISYWVSMQPEFLEMVPDEVLVKRPEYLKLAKEQAKAEAKILKDSLTGGLSLAGLEFNFNDDLKSLNESGEKDEAVVLVFFDVDSFKQINDTIGHDNADKILIDIVHKLQGKGIKEAEHLRASDRVCRRSGDEFIISALVKKGDVANFIAKIQRIIATVGQFGLKGPIKVTGGFTVINKGEEINFEIARERADKAAIYQKVLDRGTFKEYSEKDMVPDISSEKSIEDWASRIVRGEFYRELNDLENQIGRLERALSGSGLSDDDRAEYKKQKSEAEEKRSLVEQMIILKTKKTVIDYRQTARQHASPKEDLVD